MESKIIQKIGKISDERYIFWTTLIFYLLLLILNPPNKLIALSFVLLFTMYFLKIKKFSLSLFFTFIASLIVITGKTYPIQLAPSGIFSKEIYPNGYFVNLVISSTSFIAFAMLIYMIRQIVTKNVKYKTNVTDILIVIFYLLRVFSAIFGSKDPSLSLPFEILALISLVGYFYARLFIKPDSKFWSTFVHLFSALVIFESLLGLNQLAIKSPLGKNIEYQVSIEYFGHSIDETAFTFRPVGTFDHANSYGIWLASVTIFLFIFCLKYKSNILWFAFIFGTALVVTTISRSAWLGYLVSSVFIFFYLIRKHRRLFKHLVKNILKRSLVILPITVFLFAFFIIPRAQNSLYSFQSDEGASYFRFIQIDDATKIISHYPFWGIGAAMNIYEGVSLNLRTMAASLPLEVHNWYIVTALTNGLPTLLVFILFAIIYVVKILKKRREFMATISILALVICSAIAGIFQPYFNLSIILVLLSLTNSDNIQSLNGE